MDLSVEFIRAALRLSAPLILAGLGGSYMHHAGVPNIAMEGIMLVGAFAAFTTSMTFGSSLAGVIMALLIGVAFSLLYALFVLTFKADVFAVGITLNILASGICAYILRGYYHQNSVLVSTDVRMLPELHLAFLDKLPSLDLLLNNYSILIPLSFLMVVISYLVIYKTPLGYWMRAAGIKPDALIASGVNAKTIQLITFIFSGVLCGIAGAHLSIGYLGIFSLAIVAGRGFIALAVVLFGDGNPFKVLLGSLIFGAADAASLRLPETVAPQFSLMLPYVITIIAITLMTALQKNKLKISQFDS